MEVSNSLLIALMYVTIVTMSIGSILTAGAAMVHTHASVRTGGIYVNWLVLLLISHFNLFWHTLDIVQLDDPSFDIFLLVIAGPILLFFMTHIYTSGAGGVLELDDYFEDVRRRFFTLLACVQGWVIIVDVVLGDGYMVSSMFATAFLALALVLVFGGRPLRWPGVTVAWILLIATGVLAL